MGQRLGIEAHHLLCEVGARWGGPGTEWSEVSEALNPPSPLSLAAMTAQLCHAASEGNLLAVKSLLTNNVDVNSVDYDRRCPLHLAAREGKMEVVQFLLQSRAMLDKRDRWGHVPLDDARNEGHAAVEELLKQAGAAEDPESGPRPMTKVASIGERQLARCESPGKTSRQAQISPTEAAVLMNAAAASGLLSVCQDLLTKEADVNAADYDGRTPLHVAASHGHRCVVDWLLCSGAEVNRHDSFGLTPLAEAMRLERADCVKVLLDSGAEEKDVKLTDVRSSANHERLTVPVAEVQLGRPLQHSTSTTVYLATWRGTEVVAKLAGTVLPHGAALEYSRSMSWEAGELGRRPLRQITPTSEREVLREIKVLSTLRHPDLVMFLGACFDAETPFFMTEYLVGGDLQSHFERQARNGQPFRPQPAQIIRWSNSVARALCFLHNCRRPVIHRDLKPRNLLLTKSEDVKVSDFGISRMMAPRAYANVGSTGPGSTPDIGSLEADWYVAPEVLRVKNWTDRVDIYSFALILWFMSTGRTPFQDRFQEVQHLLCEYSRGEEPRPDVGPKQGRFIPAVRALMQDCWQTSPSLRPSAADVVPTLAGIAAKDDEGLAASFRRAVKRRGTS